MLSAGAGMLRAATYSAASWRSGSVCLRRNRSVALKYQQGRAPPVCSLSSMSASRSGAEPDADEGQGQCRAGAGGGGMARQPLPPRTVPDHILGFSCRTYMAGDSDDRYPNVHGVHPAEFKVELMVPVPLLALSDKEEDRLIQLVGARYREKDRVLRLVSDRFPNRIDNKRYLVHLLENILVEARNVDEDE